MTHERGNFSYAGLISSTSSDTGYRILADIFDKLRYRIPADLKRVKERNDT